jgi:hypothetical protein
VLAERAFLLRDWIDHSACNPMLGLPILGLEARACLWAGACFEVGTGAHEGCLVRALNPVSFFGQSRDACANLIPDPADTFESWPLGSCNGQSSFCRPGTYGHASPQSMVTSSAAECRKAAKPDAPLFATRGGVWRAFARSAGLRPAAWDDLVVNAVGPR